MSAYSDRQLARSSLKAYYRFGEASGTVLEDSGPNNVDGTYAASGITLGATGLVSDDADTAATFAGTSDAATVPDAAALDLGDGPFTIKFLIERVTLGTNQTVLNKGTGAYRVGFTAANALRFFKEGGTFIATGATVADTAKHHVAIEKEGDTTLLYVDGIESHTDGTLQTLTNNALILRIGFNAAGTLRLAAKLDELTIDNARLGAAYIAEDAAIARATPPPAPGGGWAWTPPPRRRRWRWLDGVSEGTSTTSGTLELRLDCAVTVEDAVELSIRGHPPTLRVQRSSERHDLAELVFAGALNVDEYLVLAGEAGP